MFFSYLDGAAAVTQMSVCTIECKTELWARRMGATYVLPPARLVDDNPATRGTLVERGWYVRSTASEPASCMVESVEFVTWLYSLT